MDAQRARRQLNEVFGIEDPANRETNQVLIDHTLAHLAADLDRACLREEQLRRASLLNRNALLKAGQYVRYWKAKFWKAHGLADKNGYYVGSTYSEHLPDSYWQERRAITGA